MLFATIPKYFQISDTSFCSCFDPILIENNLEIVCDIIWELKYRKRKSIESSSFILSTRFLLLLLSNCLIFLAWIVCRFFFSALVLARCRFAADFISFAITDCLISIFLVFLTEFGAVTLLALLALLATNLIPVNALYGFLREAIETERAIESSESDILIIIQYSI